jgi:hypothetical protein
MEPGYPRKHGLKRWGVRERLGIGRAFAAALLIAAVLTAPGTATTAHGSGGLRLHIFNLALNSEDLSFDLVLEGAFGDRQEDELRDGFATNMTYTVELWRERGFWFDKLELTRTLTMKVTYDLWAEHYVVQFRRDRLARFDTIEEVEDAACRLERLNLIDANKLDPDEEYYIAVRARLRPLTMEELGELEDWLSGDVPSGGRGGGILSIPSYLMRMLLDTTGVSDRSALAKSEIFTVEEYDEPMEDIPASPAEGDSNGVFYDDGIL